MQGVDALNETCSVKPLMLNWMAIGAATMISGSKASCAAPAMSQALSAEVAPSGRARAKDSSEPQKGPLGHSYTPVVLSGVAFHMSQSSAHPSKGEQQLNLRWSTQWRRD